MCARLVPPNRSWSDHKFGIDFGPALTQRQAAEEIESQAVREAGERTRQWRELENRTAPGGDVVVASAERTAKVQYFSAWTLMAKRVLAVVVRSGRIAVACYRFLAHVLKNKH